MAWLAALALACAIASVAGDLWVPAGDQDGAWGLIGFIGLNGTLLWVLLVSIQLLLPSAASDRRTQPVASVPSG